MIDVESDDIEDLPLDPLDFRLRRLPVGVNVVPLPLLDQTGSLFGSAPPEMVAHRIFCGCHRRRGRLVELGDLKPVFGE